MFKLCMNKTRLLSTPANTPGRTNIVLIGHWVITLVKQIKKIYSVFQAFPINSSNTLYEKSRNAAILCHVYYKSQKCSYDSKEIKYLFDFLNCTKMFTMWIPLCWYCSFHRYTCLYIKPLPSSKNMKYNENKWNQDI